MLVINLIIFFKILQNNDRIQVRDLDLNPIARVAIILLRRPTAQLTCGKTKTQKN